MNDNKVDYIGVSSAHFISYLAFYLSFMCLDNALIYFVIIKLISQHLRYNFTGQ